MVVTRYSLKLLLLTFKCLQSGVYPVTWLDYWINLIILTNANVTEYVYPKIAILRFLKIYLGTFPKLFAFISSGFRKNKCELNLL